MREIDNRVEHGEILPSDSNTIKFLDNILTQFLTLAKPDSTIAKPKFMKKTNIAVTNTQIVSSITLVSIMSLPDNDYTGFMLNLCYRYVKSMLNLSGFTFYFQSIQP